MVPISLMHLSAPSAAEGHSQQQRVVTRLSASFLSSASDNEAMDEPNEGVSPATDAGELGELYRQPIAEGMAIGGELDCIEIRGAREHNLKGLDLEIPKRQLVVFTGPSGSGKSSLAFDTLFAEGQRRYVESLSAYARQFLGQMEKPQFDALRGLSPTISIDQKSSGTNPRSTVGTITEVYDYLRLLFARVGVQHCHQCGEPVGRMTSDEIVAAVMELPERTRFMLMAPLVRNRKGEFADLFEGLMKDGFTRVHIDGEVVQLTEGMKVKKSKRHTIDVVVDRLVVKADARDRIADSVELALRVGSGVCRVDVMEGESLTFSQNLSCTSCGLAFPELSPQSFSFNSPLGMCPTCNGLGEARSMDPGLVVPNEELSLEGGAVAPWGKLTASKQKSSWSWDIVLAVCEELGIDTATPWKELKKAHRKALLEGTGDTTYKVAWKRKRSSGTWETKFEGLLNTLMRRYKETSSAKSRQTYARYMTSHPCQDCKGARLRAESQAVRIGGVGITDLGDMSIAELERWVDTIELKGNAAVIGRDITRELAARTRFLANVGLQYLSLSRPGPSLSGGEMQRIRLASQLGSELSGVLYILDEPSIGLHPRDNARLLETLTRLRDSGNTVFVVEHDEDTMRAADWLIDFGPGAGEHGGEVVFEGPPGEIGGEGRSLTGQYLTGTKVLPVPQERRVGSGAAIRIVGARENNLKGLDVEFPLGTFVCVTGVSGAGKSSLVNRLLYPAASRAVFPQSTMVPGDLDRIEGLEGINKVIEIDQKPIGRTPRSNPATYTKVFDVIRDVFANLPESRMYGYTKGRFSFNVKGGRCEACSGAGQKKIEMHFLADVYVPCEVCRGRRFNEATLKVTYRGHSITDILEMSIDDAHDLFEAHPKVSRILKTLKDVGLGYIRLGQPSPTLSGGEAQRVKLSRELAKIATGDTLYILDEPSTGLHFEDIRKLLLVVERLVNAGNTVVMIEHNLDIIKTADWLIDLGPEGGDDGGHVVALGTPEEVARCEASFTGRFLRGVLPS